MKTVPGTANWPCSLMSDPTRPSYTSPPPSFRSLHNPTPPFLPLQAALLVGMGGWNRNSLKQTGYIKYIYLMNIHK